MYKNLINKLLNHTNIAVFSHVSPDGDCLGAQLALCLWLQKNGINSTAYNESKIPANLRWMTDFFAVEDPDGADFEKFDAFVFVDGNALHRFGKTAVSLKGLPQPFYMIDHHPQPENDFDAFISVPGASSSCELVYNLISMHNPSDIDREIAKSLFTGIVTDTGSFQFDSVKPSTFAAASDLVERGKFTPPEVVEKIYSAQSINQMKLLGMALETIAFHAGQQIATMYVTAEMFEKTQTDATDTEGFVSYPLSLEGVKACVFFREENDRIKLSLRSRSEIDVNAWARKLNGGGHQKAAGAHIFGTMDEAIRETIGVGMEQINPD